MKSRSGIRQGRMLAAAAMLSLFAAQVPAATQAFKPPQPRMIANLECGGSALKGEELNYCIQLGGEAREGWVYLGFMVDKDGKPAEIAVIDSTGNANYEQVAMRALERSTFEPASFDGQPVDSAYTYKFKILDLNYRNKGVANNFATGYQAVVAAIEAGDRSEADAALARLKVMNVNRSQNLYEDAFYGLASYQYAAKWGSEAQQLEGLNRAIAWETQPQYLPAGSLQSALLSRMNIELKTHRYGEVLDTVKLLEAMGVNEGMAAQLERVAGDIEAERTGSGQVVVRGQIQAHPWFLRLFKRHFTIAVQEGSLSAIEARCERGFVRFVVKPAERHEIGDQYGTCTLGLVGAPGTRFELAES